jgi:hypothetical protein
VLVCLRWLVGLPRCQHPPGDGLLVLLVPVVLPLAALLGLILCDTSFDGVEACAHRVILCSAPRATLSRRAAITSSSAHVGTCAKSTRKALNSSRVGARATWPRAASAAACNAEAFACRREIAVDINLRARDRVVAEHVR